MLAIPIRRAGRFVVLAAAVALSHLLMLSGGWVPQGRAVAEPAPMPARMVLVVPTQPPEPAGEPPLAAAEAEPAAPPGAPQPSAVPAAVQATPRSVAAVTLPQPEPAAAQPAVAAAVEVPERGNPLAETAAAAPQAEVRVDAEPPAMPPAAVVQAQAVAASDVSPDGLPLDPPTARAVPPATWTYLASRGEAVGEALLRWSPSETDYELSLSAQVAGKPLLDWVSRGQVASMGLMPTRMVERQRERETHAVNFQRDKGLISYSGPSRTDPLLPGAQDRLSWIVQVVAVARARGTLQPGEVLRFQVAGPRGDLDEWRFTVQPAAQKLMHGRMLPLTHLLREPQRPYDLRVQIWLARQFDHLPVGLSWGVEPGGEPLNLWIQALPMNL